MQNTGRGFAHKYRFGTSDECLELFKLSNDHIMHIETAVRTEAYRFLDQRPIVYRLPQQASTLTCIMQLRLAVYIYNSC